MIIIPSSASARWFGRPWWWRAAQPVRTDRPRTGRTAATDRPTWLLALLLVSEVALALPPDRAVTQYGLRSWQAVDGLPQNSVQAIAQTPDGYVWIGTQDGLARFDGVAFTSFNRTNTPALKENYVYSLHVDRTGALWIGTSGGGVARMKDGAFTSFTTADGLTDDTVLAIREDDAGNLWLGTGRGVTVLRDGRFQAFAADAALARQRVMAVLPTRAGGIWFGTHSHGLGRWHDGRFTRLTTREGLSHDVVWSLYEDRAGVIWIGTMGGGLNRLERGRLSVLAQADGLPGDSVLGTLEDRDGNLWIATDGHGLVRHAGGRLTALTRAHGLSNDTVWPLLEGDDGILWVGTFNGLSQLRETPFVPVGRAEGLPDEIVLTVAEDRGGDVWMGTNTRGLVRLRDGRVRSYSKADGLLHDSVRSVYPDRRGNLWIGTMAGLNRFTAGRFRSFTARDGLSSEKIMALYEDGDGVLWIGTAGGGLNRLADGRLTALTTNDGLADNRVLAITDRRAGGLWLATDGSGLSLYHEGRFTNYTTRDGLGHDHLEALHEDADGTLWIGTSGGGLSRFRDGRFTTVTTRHGLPDDVAHQILEDGEGRLWVSSNRGVYRVDKRELAEVAEGRRAAVHPLVFGVDDGMRSSECNGASQPAGWRGADGRLWFPTLDGAVSVDPARLPGPMPAPRVLIEAVTVDGRAVTEADAVLPPGSGALEFAYTALDYHRPAQLRFRYRLEGFDRDWVEAGARRTAYFTNIPPGRYRFRVSAARAGGPWSESGAEAAFRLQPRLYQTPWFRASALLGLAGLIAVIVSGRWRRLAERARQLAALVQQRERAEAEVRHLNAALEDRVRERTRELESANRGLGAAVEATEAAKRAERVFLATMSHEIRTPLIGVLGMVEVLGRSELSSEQRRQLYIVHQSGRSLLRIIGDVLDFSKIEAGKMEVAAATVSLSERVSRIIGNFSAAAESKRLLLASDIDAAVAPAHVVDGSLLGQILANWVGNAVKFTEKGSVTVRVRVAEPTTPGAQTLVISVSDTGIGIAPDQLARLFEPFTQADIGTTRRYGGTGLGLAITLRLAKLIGGTVHADSTPGRGTTMSLRITLPLGDPAAMEEDSTQGQAAAAVLTRPLPTVEAARGEGSLVLLAEDHPINRLVLTQMLNLVGFQVEVADDGKQALERFAAGRYGLVFTDLHMPKMDGFQLTATIREFERAQGRQRTPIVALTANVQRQEVEHCMASGMDDFLSKPVTIQQLAGKLHQWLPGLDWGAAQGKSLPPAPGG